MERNAVGELGVVDRDNPAALSPAPRKGKLDPYGEAAVKNG